MKTLGLVATCVRSTVLVACATSITASAVAAPVRWSANGHYYQAVAVGTPISWAAANKAAKALGPGWHLATITSAEEEAFVRGLFASNRAFLVYHSMLERWLGPWIGGYNVFGPKTFQWVTGEPVWFTAWIDPSRAGGVAPISYASGFGGIGVAGWVSGEIYPFVPIAYVAELSAPPANPGLELKQTTVAGCNSVTGRVNISEPAPAGGLVVNLSDTLNSASTPASLKIPAGATSKSFFITTRPIPQTSFETGTISATFGGKTFSRQLTVRPMGLKSVTLSALHVVGGTKVIGKARLECEAGPGPVTVRLGSNRPASASPVAVSIVIPEGLQSEAFDITTSAGGYGKVWIFGTANKITKSQFLNLTQ
jgi:hypothetical protein